MKSEVDPPSVDDESTVMAPDLIAADPLQELTSAQLLDAVPDAVSVSNSSGQIIHLNDAWARLIGTADKAAAMRTQPKLSGENLMLRPDGEPINVEEFAINRALAGETVLESELIFQAPDGHRTWIQTTAAPILDENRAIVGAIASSHDVTQLRALEEEHERQRQLLRQKVVELETIIASMADAVLITDVEGMPQIANPAYQKMFGVAGSHRPATQRFKTQRVRTWDGRALSWEEGAVSRALAGEQFTDGEFIMQTANGRDIFALMSASPVRDGSGTVIGGVFVTRDVTHFREVERQKSEFLTLVAHELRTPITLIRGFAQLLRQSLEFPGSESADRWLSIIDRRSEQLARMITDLIDVTRLELGNFVIIPVRLEYQPLIRAVVDDMAALHPNRRIEIQGSDRVMVSGDESRLQQALINLIDNALTHGPPDSNVEIKLEPIGDEIITYVTDDGPPLALAERDRVFERFYQVGDGPLASRGGIGLGLNICRRIVEAHGGRIWVQNHVKSCFAYSLPIAKAGNT